MIGSFLAPLSAKIFGGLSILLLIALGVQTFRLSSEKSHHEKTRLELVATTAERDRFKADAQRMVDEGLDRTAAGQAALKEQETRSQVTLRQIARIKAVAPSAGCETPDEVKAAGI